MKSKLLISALVVSLLLSACQSSDQEKQTSSTESTTTSQTSNETKIREVTTFNPSEFAATFGQISPNLELRKIGSVEPFEKITIKSEVAGKIEKVLFEEGQIVKKDDRVAILGQSLNSDIQDITFQTALVALKNAEDQLEAKKAANAKTIENAELTIAQAAIQLETAEKSRQNLDRSTQLSVNQLYEQNLNSNFSIIEHLRDVASTGREFIATTPDSRLQDQISYLEEQLYNIPYSPNNFDLQNLIVTSDNILSEMKTLSDDNYIGYNNYYYPSYNTNYIYRTPQTNAYFDSYNDTPTPTTETGAPANSNETSTTSPTTPDSTTAIKAKIGQLLTLNSQFKSALTQYNQGVQKTDDSYITQATTSDSQLALAQVQMENSKQLFELRKVQLALEEQQLQSQIDQLNGQVALADRNRKTREITAPTTGVVLTKIASDNEQIAPSQPIIEIGDISKLKVIVAITQNEIIGLQPGQKVAIQTPSKGTIEGQIIKLPINFNNQTKIGQIEIMVDNTEFKLLPGMAVDVNFAPNKDTKTTPENPTDSQNSNIFIPINAVYFRDQTYVFVINNNTAQKKIIETGRVEQDMIEVTIGLTKDDEIITDRYEIQEGMPVKKRPSTTIPPLQ